MQFLHWVTDRMLLGLKVTYLWVAFHTWLLKVPKGPFLPAKKEKKSCYAAVLQMWPSEMTRPTEIWTATSKLTKLMWTCNNSIQWDQAKATCHILFCRLMSTLLISTVLITVLLQCVIFPLCVFMFLNLPEFSVIKQLLWAARRL